MLYPTMFWELLASHDRLTLCAAARTGKKSRRTRLATNFNCGVRFLTVPPLLPVLAHGGGLKSFCTGDPDREWSIVVKTTFLCSFPIIRFRSDFQQVTEGHEREVIGAGIDCLKGHRSVAFCAGHSCELRVLVEDGLVAALHGGGRPRLDW